ncbi:VCBS repeat-containing protein [Paenibacillus sp. R14(2021)]|uniref:FG-GAP repeat domain-containing protein n=1 Tax=Paenibacillus sp. R14(2021) TaxID=2859228 RepID=UPI001C6141DB|nr:VCBS repeat-containing protein [Paenibacillus sp. R14(2021)]
MNALRWLLRHALLAGGVFGLLLTAGCQYTATPADLLLAPRSTPENAALASALQDILPARAKLSVALQEHSNSAVLKLDADGDGEREAFVIFSDDTGTQHVMVLKQAAGGSWRQWFTFAESSVYGIDVLRTADLDRDGQPEVMIGWNQFGEPQHILTLYHVGKEGGSQDAPKPLAEMPYDTMGTGDGNGDGIPELALIQLQRAKISASLDIYQFRKDNAVKLTTAQLDGSVNAYIQVELGTIAPGRFGVVTDAAIGAHSSTTTMLAWQDGKLITVYPTKTTGDENVQTNAYTVLSGDGNGDGILDMDVLSEAPGQPDNVPYSGLLWIEEYRQWNGKDLFGVVGKRFTAGGSYALYVPLSWTNFTFRHPIDGDTNDIALDAYDEETGKREEVLTVRGEPLGGWNEKEQVLQEDDSRYLELGRSNGVVYYAVWRDKLSKDAEEQGTRTAKGSFPPDEAEMKRLFKLLPEA